MLGIAVSVAALLCPLALAATPPWQVRPETVQLSVAAAHEGTEHDAPDGVDQVPALQVKVAAPVVGIVLSVNDRDAPPAVAGAAALQV